MRRGRDFASPSCKSVRRKRCRGTRHSNVQDTFYVIEGELRLFMKEPEEDVRLKPSETYSVRAGRPHLVTNAGKTSATFLVLQGIGEYDFIPLV